MHPDLPADDERILSSVAQFDILLGLAVADKTGEVRGGTFYPHFKGAYSHRSDPAVVTLLEDDEARRILFHGSEQDLADALRAIGELGATDFFTISGWDGYEDSRIQDFLAEHPPQSSSSIDTPAIG